MKRLILSTAILIALSSAAGAQTTTGSSPNGTSVSSTAKPKKGKSGKRKTTHAKAAQADTATNQETDKWKDGQRATPTGHEATGTNGAHATVPKDTATSRRDSTKQ